MSAVESLLRRLESLESVASRLSDPTLAEPAIAEHLQRGLAVHGLIAVESFLRDRMREWSSIIQNARIPPSRLPGGTKQYEDRVLEVLPRRIRDPDYAELSQRSLLLGEIGRSLTSLYSGELVPHYLAFMWAGSNIQAQDIESIVSLVGTPQNEVWKTLTSVWNLVDTKFPGNTNLRNVFESLCDLRHRAAHHGTPSLPTLSLRPVARNARILCLCVDVVVTGGLRLLISPPSRSSASPRPGRTPLRKLVNSGSQWAEYGPGSRRAYRRHQSLDEALRSATPRARAGNELVLVVDRDDNILDWRYPVV